MGYFDWDVVLFYIFGPIIFGFFLGCTFVFARCFFELVYLPFRIWIRRTLGLEV